jgi:DnaJ family protein C protein 7
LLLEEYEEAVRDLEKAYSIDQSISGIKEKIRHAKLELKKSKRKDYYKILGIAKDANDDEIKKAYKKKALLWHPDKHSNGTEEKKDEAVKAFKDIGEAYALLSDPRKRNQYD